MQSIIIICKIIIQFVYKKNNETERYINAIHIMFDTELNNFNDLHYYENILLM